MGNFAGSTVSPRCARSLTTSPSKRARCSKRACRRKRHSTGTSCRRNSRTSLCFPGDLPSARRLRSFTRSGGKRNWSDDNEENSEQEYPYHRRQQRDRAGRGAGNRQRGGARRHLRLEWGGNGGG